MTFASIFNDMVLLGIFLLLGFIIREFCKPIQKLFIPASVVGGVIALIIGPQVLHLVDVPKSFASMSGVLINLVMTAIVFGVTIDKSKIRNYVDFTMYIATTYGIQMTVGMILSIVFCNIWTELPKGWGIMGLFGFWGGHGTVGAAGAVFQELGVKDNLGLGMILATIGVVCGIVVGMILVNYGVRKGYANYIEKEESALGLSFFGGILPIDKQVAIGKEKVSSVGINNVALQLAFLLSCLFIGNYLMKFIKIGIPTLAKMPNIINGMVGGMIVWPIMKKFKIEGYVDSKTIKNLSGLALEFIILSAVATTNLNLVTKFALPIIIYTLIMIGLMVLCALFLAKKYFKNDWYEKSLIAFGENTGNLSTGLALVRCVDPESKSSAYDACGIGTTLWAPVYGVMPAIAPMIIMQSENIMIGLGVIILVSSLLITRIFFWQK
ncbi:sodium/glutamate symporter [Acidaminococcus sp. DS4831]|uniref:sodium/glutamate symporter n=1 Tax=Acidaminococcus sp. DS4831 TaxID=3141399 RepID=UPI0032E4A834